MSLKTAATAMSAFTAKVEVLANNLSNANTTGFKKSEVNFADHLYQYRQMPNQDSPTGKFAGKGVIIRSTNTIHNQGSIRDSENNMDLAINGKGFFKFLNPITNQTAYSRNGKLQVDDQGKFTNSNGYVLDPAVTISADQTLSHISEDGRVWATQAGSKVLSQIGNIQLFDFSNAAGLESVGNSMYLETSTSGNPIAGNPKTSTFGSLISGAVEVSNVSIIKEMIDLVKTHKDFDSNQKVISAEDKMSSSDLIR